MYEKCKKSWAFSSLLAVNFHFVKTNASCFLMNDIEKVEWKKKMSLSFWLVTRNTQHAKENNNII